MAFKTFTSVAHIAGMEVLVLCHNIVTLYAVQPANVRAALALKLHQEKLSGLHWEGLARRGKQKQMVFWTSIAVKDPSYPDPPLCINPLIYGDTVSYFVPDTNLM